MTFNQLIEKAKTCNMVELIDFMRSNTQMSESKIIEVIALVAQAIAIETNQGDRK